ncbi:MAG: tRNA 2-selenouridine(34) synthase MnmH [Candidatus Kapabacteria bacterium]|nr:tRNA 2-selenouridine(34) synthase MnmH [Candidatus Kapabacteria bacterium]MBX7153727.1 tRNA 2-selenouridine(34) synthase MnmH [Bacteroidota bacterium]
MPNIITIQHLLSHQQEYCIVDVRTPAEFEKGHIPSAVNIPIFTNEERAIVGTLYVQQGKSVAIKKGLELVGPKMKWFIDSVEDVISKTHNKNLLVHCWRGGMRSASMAWLFELYGLQVSVLKGGYKYFRRHVLDTLEKQYPFIILGGFTGTGKTHILKQLRILGEPVIDLELLAGHKGSAFGWLGEPYQPTQEHFENMLAVELLYHNNVSRIWLEDESRRIGNVNIPLGLWNQMREVTLIVANVPVEQRIQNLLQDYSHFTTDELMDSLVRLRQRLGGAVSKEAEEALQQRNLTRVIELTLVYYDKYYTRSMEQREREKIKVINLTGTSVTENAEFLLKYVY